MALTPMMLVAMQGLLNNNSIDINSDFQNELNIYANQPIVKKYRELFGQNYYFSGGPTAMPITTILPQIRDMYNSYPFMIDSYLGDNCGTTSRYLTEYLLDWSYMILGTHRNQKHINTHAKFIMNFQSVLGYVEQMNGVINSTINGAGVGASSFTSMNEITTGNLSAVTTSTSKFGDDLLNTGDLLDFTELKYYGTPHGLTLALIRTNAIALLSDEFLEININISDLVKALSDSIIEMLPEVQKIIYSMYQTVTGKKLEDVMLVLGAEIEGINTLADLLDTKKIFPNSVDHLLAMKNKTLIPLFESDGVDSVLKNIIPEKIARYNVDFRNTLLQVKNIISTQVSDLAEQFQAIESSAGLDDINEFDKPLPGSISSSGTAGAKQTASSSSPSSTSNNASVAPAESGILDAIAKGQGENGLFYVTDGVGTPCGTTHLDTLKTLNDYHDNITDSLETDIVNKEQEIVDQAWAADAQYRIDNPEPLRSDYPAGPIGDTDYNTDWNAWNQDRIAYIETQVDPLLNDLQGLINQLPGTPDVVQESFDASLKQVVTEKFVLNEAIDWPVGVPDQVYEIHPEGGLCGGLWNMITTPANKKIIIGFSESLHSLSEKTDLHSAVEVLEKLSMANQGGDGIIGSLREGRNLKRLDKVNVKTDTRISPVDKNAQPGEILSSET